jgi:hypothetical protein
MFKRNIQLDCEIFSFSWLTCVKEAVEDTTATEIEPESMPTKNLIEVNAPK